MRHQQPSAATRPAGPVVVAITRLLTAAVVASSLTLSGCYSYTIRTNAASDGVQHKGRGSVIFWGLGGTTRHAQECDAGLAYSRTYQPVWSVFVSLLTIGIVTPWRAKYECAVDNGAPAGGMAQPAVGQGFTPTMTVPGTPPATPPAAPAN